MRFDVTALRAWLESLPAVKIGGLAVALAGLALSVHALRWLLEALSALIETLISLLDVLERLLRRVRRFRRYLRSICAGTLCPGSQPPTRKVGAERTAMGADTDAHRAH
jgi:hypothetical protein